MPVRALLDRIPTAGQLFVDKGAPAANLTPPHAPFDRYQRSVVEATGLPAGWVRMSAYWLAFGLRHAAESLHAQSPTTDLNIYDDPAYTQETDVGLAFMPRVRVLGGMIPSNDPPVYARPVLALAMKIPIVLRPSGRDPLTAVRLARALEVLAYPNRRSTCSPGIIRSAKPFVTKPITRWRSAPRGGRSFRTDPSVETYGPGKSVIIRALKANPDQMDDVGHALQRQLDMEKEDVDRGEILRFALRLGFQKAAPEEFEAVREAARKQATKGL